jgi:hypothetical protein
MHRIADHDKAYSNTVIHTCTHMGPQHPVLSTTNHDELPQKIPNYHNKWHSLEHNHALVAPPAGSNAILALHNVHTSAKKNTSIPDRTVRTYGTLDKTHSYQPC